ncbi:unnamed protein product [Taenia asiatica]|uniref:Uncharacterized protein n=1 Tax=Taenia asiatica TaxID=60517 RepID=A0A0R3W8I7_TAEAS|nr:unnamed protein product [Taenia asiatica]
MEVLFLSFHNITMHVPLPGMRKPLILMRDDGKEEFTPNTIAMLECHLFVVLALDSHSATWQMDDGKKHRDPPISAANNFFTKLVKLSNEYIVTRVSCKSRRPKQSTSREEEEGKNPYSSGPPDLIRNVAIEA